MTQEEFVVEMARRLESAGIPFMLAGAHSSSVHGKPRATQDVDWVIDPTEEQLKRFVVSLGDEYYVDPEAARDALSNRTMFNVILLSEGLKADLIIRKNRPFSRAEFDRRRKEEVHGRLIEVASPEDVILSKLEWNRITPSDRQVQDALDVLTIQAADLDLSYLRHWAKPLGVSDTLEEMIRCYQTRDQGQAV